MFTVSMIVSCLNILLSCLNIFCLCNDVITRYMFQHALLFKNGWKTFRISIFISQGYSWITIIYIQRGKRVRDGEGTKSGIEKSNGVL